MRYVALLAGIAVLASGCGGSDRASTTGTAEPAAHQAAPPPPTPTDPSTGARARDPVRPLSAIDLRRIREVATRIERGLVIFERRTRSCPEQELPRCIETAWQGIVGDVLGSEWDLTAFRDLQGNCRSLDAAIEAILGFNLGARQIDYGPPGEVDATSRQSERLALVDMLRPIPSELRASDTAACRG